MLRQAPVPGTRMATIAAQGGARAARPAADGARSGRSARTGILLLAPTFLFTVALLAVPLLSVLAHSFWTQNYLDIDTRFTLDRYVEVWTDPLYRTLMLRSLAVSAVTTVLTVAMAYPIAYYIAFHGGQRRGLWLFLVTIPFWTSYLLRVFAWKVILGYEGVLNSGLLALGLIAAPLDFLLYNVNAVVLTLTHAWAAFAILPIYVSLRKIDGSLLEAATDLGDGPVRRFLRVTLPLSLPGVIGAAVVIFIPTVGDYITPKLVGGPDGAMIANMIQVQFGRGNDWPSGAALAVSAVAIVSAATLLLIGVLRLGARLVR